MVIILSIAVFCAVMWAAIAIGVTYRFRPRWLLLTGFIVALALAIMTARAFSQDTETAMIVLCDTAAQVESVVKRADSKSTMEAIEGANEEARDPRACVIVAAVYIRGKENSRIANRHGAFGIFSVMVLAVRHPSGMFMPLQIPFEGFAPVKVGEGERKT